MYLTAARTEGCEDSLSGRKPGLFGGSLDGSRRGVACREVRGVTGLFMGWAAAILWQARVTWTSRGGCRMVYRKCWECITGNGGACSRGYGGAHVKQDRQTGEMYQVWRIGRIQGR